MINLQPSYDIPRIIATVAGATGVTVNQITGPSRRREHVWPRFAAMAIARRATNAPLAKIGRAMGDRDHTSVMNALERVEVRERADAKFAQAMRTLTEIVASSGKMVDVEKNMGQDNDSPAGVGSTSAGPKP